MNNDEKIYQGIDLLEKVLEFVAMSPIPQHWNLSSLQSNPPRYIRFKQITALFYAFNFTEQPKGFLKNLTGQLSADREPAVKDFLEGRFLTENSNKDYSQVYEFMESFLKINGINGGFDFKFASEELQFIFQQLISYKKQLRALLEFNSGVIEASSKTFLFSIYLTESISKNIFGKTEDLDQTLELLINPEGLRFTEKELIKKYSYPTENLSDIDIEWM